MEKLDHLISELEAARQEAISRFAEEANMPVLDFQRHFRVVMDELQMEDAQVSFRVVPRE